MAIKIAVYVQSSKWKF